MAIHTDLKWKLTVLPRVLNFERSLNRNFPFSQETNPNADFFFEVREDGELLQTEIVPSGREEYTWRLGFVQRNQSDCNQGRIFLRDRDSSFRFDVTSSFNSGSKLVYRYESLQQSDRRAMVVPSDPLFNHLHLNSAYTE